VTNLPSKLAVEARIVRLLCDPTGYTIPAQLLECYKHSIGQLWRKGIIFVYKIIHQLVEIYPPICLLDPNPEQDNIHIVILTDYYKLLNILTNTHFPICFYMAVNLMYLLWNSHSLVVRQ
jgi:hypothetical protein